MKKHLLSIFALLACFFVGYAQSETQTVTVDLLNNDFSFERGSSSNQNVSYIDAGTAIQVDPVTVTLAATEGATNVFRLWDDGLRVYKNKGANLVVAVPQGKAITSIRLVTSGTWGLPEGAEGTWHGGNKEWTGEAQSVTLNFTATGTKYVSKIIVTYKETAAAAAPGDGTKEHPYSIAEAVAAGVSGTLESDVWICGYIVGYTKGAFFAPGPQFTADGAPEYRILLSDNPEETAIKGCLDVLNFNMTDYTGDEKKAKEAELCLKRNPSNLGKKVAIKVYVFQPTSMNNYYTTQGIHNFYFMDEQGGGEDPEPSTGFTSGTYRVRNVANRGYLTYTVGANTETTQTPVDCIITSTDGVFNIYFGEPSKRYLYCGTNGKFSGNLSPNSIKIYEVDSQTDQATTAHFVTELQLGKQYILTGEKSGMTYALSYETTGTGEEQRMLSTPVVISGETATLAPGNKYFWEFVDPNAVETYSLTINANGCEYALVGEDGDVDLNAIPAGSTLIFGISSIPEGKTLTAVKLNGTALEGESTYEFTINQNSTLDVELANAPVLHTLTIMQNEGGKLEVLDGETKLENGAKVEEGKMLTLVATPDKGYEFSGFFYNGSPLDGDLVIVEEDVTVAAAFTSTSVSYTAPAGTTKSDNYLATITSEGADENLNLTYDSHPGIYNVINGLTVTPGNEFTLNLTAKSAGPASDYVAYEDLRYCVAYIFVDWKGTGAFESLATYGKVPPTNKYRGNYDDVMELSQAFTMPADVELGTVARIRVIYANALTRPGTNSSDKSETPDPNSQYIDGGIAYDFVVNTPAPAPEVTGKSIVVPAAELGQNRDHYSFRFDDAPLGSHTNGTNTADTDLRTRSFTYSAWVNVKDLGARNVVMGNIQTKYADATGAFTVKLEDGKLTLNGRSATSLTAFENAQGTPSTDEGTALDEWVFVSVVADQAAKKVTLYKNAQPISSFDTDYGVGLLHDQAQFHIADAGSSIAISEVQLWNKALTLDELKNSYNLEYTETPEGLVAYFKAGELVEGSTTELRNLGTEATTTASILKGTYNLVQWDPFFKNPVAQDLEVLDETHAHKTVTVTLQQPAKEGNSFTVTGKKGRQITDTATLYELLTVVPELAEGETLEGVLVTDAAGETVYTLDQMPIYANSDMTIALRLASDPEVPTYLVKADVTLGYATVSVDDEAAVNLPAEGLEVKEGRKVVVTLVPESATYQLESFKVNGEDATEALAGYNYTIDAIAAECSIEAVFATPKHHLTISQNGVKGESFYGEFRNNLNVRLEYDDAEGAYVEPGTTVLFVLITPTEGNYELKGVTDNGNPVDLMEFSGDKAIFLSRVSEDHDFVITQDQKVGLIAVGEDGSALTYADGELKVAADAAVIEVVDMNGRLVARANDVTLSVAELAQGVYVAKATTAEGTYTLKFVKF